MREMAPKYATSDAKLAVLSVFPSPLGWMGLVGDGCRVTALTFGHTSPVQVRLHLEAKEDVHATERDWSPDVRERLQAYAAGAMVDFSGVALDESGKTPFRKAVVRALREVGYGQTVSYSQLAAAVGSPHAARAVGTVMSSNCVPIIVPCHRVVAESGRLGGYSGPSGLSMKKRLLELEGVTHIQSDGHLSWRRND